MFFHNFYFHHIFLIRITSTSSSFFTVWKTIFSDIALVISFFLEMVTCYYKFFKWLVILFCILIIFFFTLVALFLFIIAWVIFFLLVLTLVIIDKVKYTSEYILFQKIFVQAIGNIYCAFLCCLLKIALDLCQRV